MEKYQIKISIKGIKPPIWRRIELSPLTLLEDLHYIIQDSMGWTDSHLHYFKKGNVCYQPEEQLQEEDEVYGYRIENVDYTNIKLSDILTKEKDKMTYMYDFGDSWEHEVVLEKIIATDKELSDPVCTGGKRACPPEDCGGVPGYMRLLEILQNPKDKEYKIYMEWLGLDPKHDHFDPEEFDIKFVNVLISGGDEDDEDFNFEESLKAYLKTRQN